MKKTKTEYKTLEGFNAASLAQKIDRQGCQSLLAPQVRKCLDTYGKESTRRALEWIVKQLKEKNESH